MITEQRQSLLGKGLETRIKNVDPVCEEWK
jgi:hypothetical protein